MSPHLHFGQISPAEATLKVQKAKIGSPDDHYWNAAMQEMRRTGYMHNYMRMYWGIEDSGYGRDLSRHGMRAFVNLETIWID